MGLRRGTGFSAGFGEVGEDFVVGEDGGLGFQYLGKCECEEVAIYSHAAIMKRMG